MPIYEYRCRDGHANEVLRTIAERDGKMRCLCGRPAQRILTVPTMHTWNQERKFHNISHHDDGLSFPSRAAYEGFLKETGQAEVATDAPGKTKPGSKVVMKCRL